MSEDVRAKRRNPHNIFVMARLDRATQPDRVCGPVTLFARGRALLGGPHARAMTIWGVAILQSSKNRPPDAAWRGGARAAEDGCAVAPGSCRSPLPCRRTHPRVRAG